MCGNILEAWSLKNGFFHKIGPKAKIENNQPITSFSKIDMKEIGIYDDEAFISLCLRAEYGFTWLISEYDELSLKGAELMKAIRRLHKWK